MAAHKNSNFFVGESSNESDRRGCLKAFDDMGYGVKWLSETVTEVPSAFYSKLTVRNQYPEAYNNNNNNNPILIIDMEQPLEQLVAHIKQASCTIGYFQIVNHGVPLSNCDQVLQGMTEFYDTLTYEQRKFWYGRSSNYNRGVYYNATHDLCNGQDPTWHDTLYVRLGPDRAPFIPDICIAQVDAWDKKMRPLAFRIANLLAKGLDLNDDPLSWMLGRVGFFGNFYPKCPNPERVEGFQAHTDPCLFTILLQDDSGGLQGLYNGKWYDIKPVPGALVVFIGDLLEILSNGVYESGVHRVKSSSRPRTRFYVAQTFSPGFLNTIYKPFDHLVTSDRPLKFNPVEMSEYVRKFFNTKLTIKTMVEAYKKDLVHRHPLEPRTELCLGLPGGI